MANESGNQTETSSGGQDGDGGPATPKEQSASRFKDVGLPVILALLTLFGTLTGVIGAGIGTWLASRTEADVDLQELALEGQRFDEERDRTKDGWLEKYVPYLVGEDPVKQREAVAILLVVLPDRDAADVFSQLLDIGPTDAKALFVAAREEAQNRADTTEWAIVVGTKETRDEATALLASVTERDLPAELYHQNNGYAVAATGFDTKESADGKLLALQATGHESAQTVDLNAWCPHRVVVGDDPTECVATQYDQAALTSRPIIYWPLATDTGIDLTDRIGTYDLTPLNGDDRNFEPVFLAGPRDIGALSLDASASQRLESSFNPSDRLGGSAWTLEVWMQPPTGVDANDVATVVGGWGISPNRRWYVNLRNGNVCIGIGDFGGVCGTDKSVNDGLWHHVAASYNSETGAAALYVDGDKLDAFIDAKNNPLSAPPWGPDEQFTDAAVSIGAMLDEARPKWSEFWNGGLSRLAIYDTVLDPEEVLAHVQAFPDEESPHDETSNGSSDAGS